MKFEYLLENAMREDVEVCKAVQRLYRGDLGEKVTSDMYGDRFVVFMVNVCEFENRIREEIESFIGDVRFHHMRLFPEYTAVLTPNATDGWCNYMWRVVSGDIFDLDYSYLRGERTFGKTLIPKKDLVKVLKERGWM